MKRTVLLAAAIAGCWLAAPPAMACGTHRLVSPQDWEAFRQRMMRPDVVTESSRNRRLDLDVQRSRERIDRVPYPFDFRRPQSNGSSSTAIPRC